VSRNSLNRDTTQWERAAKEAFELRKP